VTPACSPPVRQHAGMGLLKIRARTGRASFLWTKASFRRLARLQTIVRLPARRRARIMIATAYFATQRIFSQTASAGTRRRRANYRALFENIRAAFQREYVTSTARLTSNTQTLTCSRSILICLLDALRAEAAPPLNDVTGGGELPTPPHGSSAIARCFGAQPHPSKSKSEREHVSGLGIRGQPRRRRHVLALERRANVLEQRSIIPRVVCASQHLSRFCEKIVECAKYAVAIRSLSVSRAGIVCNESSGRRAKSPK